ncbi:MAG: glutaredoxin [Sandaracinus sp.]|nr:glutaredoxin [Sandaracinus sp.]MCB9611955.1 glutaredoxin [Sandaracinus sp.]MCB9625698.1 glutaredoxin [Sandaracinus sp.]MCB9634737.1 glutaredoxin [Sandaracinus sp.]
MAVQLLRDKGVPFEQIDVDGNREKRAWLREVTGQSTVPQIFVGGRSLGGYTDVASLDRRGELDPLLHPTE